MAKTQVEQHSLSAGVKRAYDYLLAGTEHIALHPIRATQKLSLTSWMYPEHGPKYAALSDLVRDDGIGIDDVAVAVMRLRTQGACQVEIVGGDLQDVQTILQQAYERRIVPDTNTAAMPASISLKSNSLKVRKSATLRQRCPWDVPPEDTDAEDGAEDGAGQDADKA